MPAEEQRKEDCIACSCSGCKERRLKLDDTSINLVYKDTVVNLFDTYWLENTQKGEHFMIFDPGIPVSLAQRSWLSKYLQSLTTR